MADIETSVAITAQTDDLQSGIEEAAAAVETATASMKAQFADLGTAAQQAHERITTAAAQIGSAISALQRKTASLAGSIGGAMGQIGNSSDALPGISVSPQGSRTESGRTSSSRLQFWHAELQSQLAEEQAFFTDSKAEELEFWQDKLALTEAGSRKRLAVENNIYQLEKQLALQSERDRLASLADDERVADAAYARKKAATEEKAELGKISTAAEIAQLKDALDAEWALERDYYDKKLAVAQNDTQTQGKLIGHEKLAFLKYLTERDKLNAQAVQNSQKQWQGLLQPIQRALSTSITGIIVGTTTVQKALADLAQSIIADFVNSAVGGVFSSLGKMLGASLVGGGSGNQDFSGRVGGDGEDVIGGNISEGLFGSGSVFAALGLGNLFSGGLFGSLFKGIGSLFCFGRGGVVPSAAGGWMVPNTSLAMLHANEMVLPANISEGLQGMLASGGSPPSVNATFAVSAIDSQSVATFFKNNGATLVAALNQAMRNGSMLRGTAS